MFIPTICKNISRHCIIIIYNYNPFQNRNIFPDVVGDKNTKPPAATPPEYPDAIAVASYDETFCNTNRSKSIRTTDGEPVVSVETKYKYRPDSDNTAFSKPFQLLLPNDNSIVVIARCSPYRSKSKRTKVPC